MFRRTESWLRGTRGAFAGRLREPAHWRRDGRQIRLKRASMAASGRRGGMRFSRAFWASRPNIRNIIGRWAQAPRRGHPASNQQSGRHSRGGGNSVVSGRTLASRLRGNDEKEPETIGFSRQAGMTAERPGRSTAACRIARFGGAANKKTNIEIHRRSQPRRGCVQRSISTPGIAAFNR